jgi:hypothetical protein
MKLEGLDRHHRLIDSYKKLHTERGKVQSWTVILTTSLEHLWCPVPTTLLPDTTEMAAATRTSKTKAVMSFVQKWLKHF